MATAVLTALVGLIPGLEELLVPASAPLKHKLHLVPSFISVLLKRRLSIQARRTL